MSSGRIEPRLAALERALAEVKLQLAKVLEELDKTGKKKESGSPP